MSLIVMGQTRTRGEAIKQYPLTLDSFGIKINILPITTYVVEELSRDDSPWIHSISQHLCRAEYNDQGPHSLEF